MKWSTVPKIYPAVHWPLCGNAIILVSCVSASALLITLGTRIIWCACKQMLISTYGYYGVLKEIVAKVSIFHWHEMCYLHFHKVIYDSLSYGWGSEDRISITKHWFFCLANHLHTLENSLERPEDGKYGSWETIVNI